MNTQEAQDRKLVYLFFGDTTRFLFCMPMFNKFPSFSLSRHVVLPMNIFIHIRVRKEENDALADALCPLQRFNHCTL